MMFETGAGAPGKTAVRAGSSGRCRGAARRHDAGRAPGFAGRLPQGALVNSSIRRTRCHICIVLWGCPPTVQMLGCFAVLRNSYKCEQRRNQKQQNSVFTSNKNTPASRRRAAVDRW